MTKYILLAVISTLISNNALAEIEQYSNKFDLIKKNDIEYKIPSAVIGKDASLKRINIAYAEALRSTPTYIATSKIPSADSGRGIRTSVTNETIKLLYINQYTTVRNDFIAEYKLQILRDADDYVIKVTCPSFITNEYYREIPLINWPKLDWKPVLPKEQIISEVNGICSEPILSFFVLDEGEINADFSDTSVLANFTRKLKSYSPNPSEITRYDLENSKWFTFQDNGIDLRIAISVVPYRNGSKVLYRSNRTVACQPNSSCANFDPTLSERVRTALAKIAND